MSTTEDRVIAIEKDIAAFKAYLIAAAAVVAVFGVAGAWGLTVLSAVKTELSTAQEQTKQLTAKVDVEKNRIDALGKLVNPEQVEIAVRSKIDAIAPTTVAALAKTELARAVAVTSAAGTEGCLQLDQGKLQVCWGSQELAAETHVRRFNVKFPRAFASAPVVVPGINTHSDGEVPAVYQFAISESTYVGVVNNMNSSRPQTGKVVLSYVAMGLPAK